MCWRSTAAAPSMSISWRPSPASRTSRSTILRTVMPLFISAANRLQSPDMGPGMKMCAWGVGPSRSTVALAPIQYTAISSIKLERRKRDRRRLTYGNLDLNTFNSDNATYDLTTNTLAHINYLYGDGLNLTLKINSAVASGGCEFYGNGTNDQLVTSDAMLDLSHSSVSGFTVASTNAIGTTFTVQDVGTAFQIAGGPGRTPSSPMASPSRPPSATPSSLPPRWRRSSIPAAPIRRRRQNPSVFTLTTGPDTFVGGAEDDTVNGTAATLNPGDRLTGGGGNDVLALYGSGTFQVDQLATFTGFSTISPQQFYDR